MTSASDAWEESYSSKDPDGASINYSGNQRPVSHHIIDIDLSQVRALVSKVSGRETGCGCQSNRINQILVRQLTV